MDKTDIILFLIAIIAVLSPFITFYVVKIIKELGGLKW